jgi:S-adenosylmethionine decarboxylase
MVGIEWIVEAQGCSPIALRSEEALRDLFDCMIRDLDLHVVGDGRWHQFPHSGGITGVYLLSESHLTCHTFPEFGSLCLNLFSCRPRARWDFEMQLEHRLGACDVQVRQLERSYASGAALLRFDKAEREA